jgi:hypothetical protein
LKKKQWLDEYKLERGCADCGYRDRPEALEFDHLPEFEKSFTISLKVMSKTLDKLQEEVAKCEVVCSNCHRIRTTARHRAANGPWAEVDAFLLEVVR